MLNNNPNNKEKKCSEYHKSPMQVCVCSCHKSGQLTQGCDFPISTPPVENRTDGTGVPSGLEMRTDTGSPQSNTMETKLIEAIKEASVCYGWDKYDETDDTHEKPKLIHENDMLMSEIIEAILPVFSQVRKETIREMKEKLKDVKREPMNGETTGDREVDLLYRGFNQGVKAGVDLLSKDIEQ